MDKKVLKLDIPGQSSKNVGKHGLLVALKVKFNRHILASVHYAFAVLRLLARAPFSPLPAVSAIKDIRICYK